MNEVEDLVVLTLTKKQLAASAICISVGLLGVVQMAGRDAALDMAVEVTEVIGIFNEAIGNPTNAHYAETAALLRKKQEEAGK